MRCTTALAAAFLVSTLPSLAPAWAALVGHYRLDETVAGPVINSVSPPHGTNSGATINQPGQVNLSYDFAGAGQFVSISNPGVGGGSFSIAAWINADSLVGAQATYGMGVMQSTSGENVGDYMLSVGTGGEIRFWNWRSAGNDATGRHTTATGLIVEDTWMHVAATWNGVSNAVYVNGVSVAFANTVTDTGWLSLNTIGKLYTGTGGYSFDGRVDDVGIWTNQALTASQVFSIYSRGLNGVDLQLALVPEPSTLSLFTLALSGVAIHTRRRRAMAG